MKPSRKELQVVHDYDVYGLFTGPKTLWSSREISKTLGLGESWVNSSAQRLVEEGKLREVTTSRQKIRRWELVEGEEK